MNNNKRMIYIYDDNIKTYDSIENKSEWINAHLRELKMGEQLDIEVEVNRFEQKIREMHERSRADSGTE